ncbi:zinc finger BED domain-containing protein 5-like [Clavelina lepadiformis]|uniref:zinc finger BED domain-containing protein 5-like n=1 Tax=Clavelina lepadiformis TaxID=159417 RepID=UPI00404238B3
MVPLSNNTIKWRTQELSEDVLQQTIASVKQSGKFSLQLDETTDIGNDAQLMVFVRYVEANYYEERFLLCRGLAKNTTGEQIFNKVNSFIKEHQLEWSVCVSVCANGAPSGAPGK